MSVEMLDRVLAKCTAEAKVMLAQLYFLNQPFLLQHMPQMVACCHKYRVPVLLSSNLNVFKNAPAILAEAPDKLMLSVSGWTQEISSGIIAGAISRPSKRTWLRLLHCVNEGLMFRLAGTIIDITNMKLP